MSLTIHANLNKGRVSACPLLSLPCSRSIPVGALLPGATNIFVVDFSTESEGRAMISHGVYPAGHPTPRKRRACFFRSNRIEFTKPERVN